VPAAQAVHALELVDAANLPEGHGVAFWDEAGQYEPFGQAVLEVLSQNEPASQGAHEVCPALAWYDPAAHSTQLRAEATEE